MWSCRVAIAALCLFLSACGFEPMYAEGNAAGAIVSHTTPGIEIAQIPDRDGQYLRNLLIDRFYTNGRPANPKYTVDFTPLKKDTVNMGIQRSATATRAQMQIITHMRLLDKITGQVLLERDLKTTGAYNLLDNQLATLSSQQSTADQMLQQLSDDAVTELSLYFRRLQQGAAQ